MLVCLRYPVGDRYIHLSGVKAPTVVTLPALSPRMGMEQWTLTSFENAIAVYRLEKGAYA